MKLYPALERSPIASANQEWTGKLANYVVMVQARTGVLASRNTTGQSVLKRGNPNPHVLAVGAAQYLNLAADVYFGCRTVDIGSNPRLPFLPIDRGNSAAKAIQAVSVPIITPVHRDLRRVYDPATLARRHATLSIAEL